MNWLPIVNRELRVAARKRSTFWLRVAAALTALLIGGAFLMLSAMQGTRAFQMGSALFAVLTWLCAGAGLCAGLFFTSDCLSEEKREGTLGLLFLTDLRGYDVALGKLLATSLRGFYALLAVLPVLAITLLMGGVAGGEFWRSALALVNALFFSLAAGMFVSALSRDAQKAMMGTLLLLLVFAAGGPAADATWAGMRHRNFEPWCSLASPAYVLVSAGGLSRSPYWTALAVTQLLGWAMLAGASALVPHTWQERKKAGAGSRQGWSYVWRYGGARRRLRLRTKLIGREPVTWLVCRERWQALGLWLVTILVAGGFAWSLFGKEPMEMWMLWNTLGGLFWALVYLWAASQACRFPIEARRSGLLELLLATPLDERRIVAGQWRGMARLFGWPVLLLLAVQLCGATLSQMGYQRVTTQASNTMSATATAQSSSAGGQTTNANPGRRASAQASPNVAVSARSFHWGGNGWQVAGGIVAAVFGALSVLGNLLALGWFGMWMGMTSKGANLATLKTILFVQVIPWFVILFGSGMLMMLWMSGLAVRGMSSSRSGSVSSIVWWPILSAALGALAVLAKDIGFIVWSRNKLHSAFRAEAARSLGQPRVTGLPPLPPMAPIPPLAAAPRQPQDS